MQAVCADEWTKGFGCIELYEVSCPGGPRSSLEPKPSLGAVVGIAK